MTLNARIELNRPGGFRLDVDIEVPGTGITGLFGPSGSGKSTLLRCLAGLERGNRGDRIEIRFDGEVWQDARSCVPPHRRAIGYVFQDAHLLPHLTVRGNLEYALSRRRASGGPSMAQVVEWLELSALLDQPATRLSGGEIQRTAIGRALVGGARLILMDEPLASVDRAAKNRILPYLDNMHQVLDVPVIYVTHLLDELTYLADHVIVLDAGKAVATGSLLDLSSRLDLALSHDESAGALLDCTVAGHDESFGLSTLSFDGGELLVTRRPEPPGSKIRVRVPARDVSLTLDRPERTSILNIIPATVDAVERVKDARVLVRLAAGSQFLLARVTRKSAEHLSLAAGLRVFAQIKSVALLTEPGNE